MVLLSFLLVLAAAVTLVIGLVGTGLGLIYLSIACSLAAGIVLAVAVVRSRPTTELAAAGPAPLPSNDPHAFSSTPAPPRGVSVLDRDDSAIGRGDTLDVGERIRVFAEPEPTIVREPEPEPVADVDAVLAAEELDEVTEVDVEPAGEDLFATAESEPEPAFEPAAASTSWDVRDDDWADADTDVFPIADYDTLRVSQIVPLLGELDPDELEVVRDREIEVKGGRVSILNRIDALLGRPATTAPAPAKKRAPAKKAAATKAATASKAPAKRTGSTSAVKKAAAKKAPAPAKKPAPAAKKAAPKKATKATKATKKQP